MSLRKNKTLLITLSVLILLILSVALLFPSITKQVITGLASIDTFFVSVSVIHAFIDIDNRTQLDPVIVNGTNITIRAPIIYYANITVNLTLDMPTGFECGVDWYVNESGSIKNVTVNGTELSWEADKSVKNTSIYFDVPPPTIISQVVYTGDSYYERTIIIESCAPLANISANVSVSTLYEDYVLYLIENNTLINRTAEYSLQVSNGRAFFSGFNLSNNKTFRIQAAPNATIVQQIVNVGSSGGGGGGGGGAIPLINYTPTQQFSVEPNHISIITSERGPLEASILIYNLRGADKEFTISFTKNFISSIASTVFILHKEFVEVPVYMNTTGIMTGEYTDYIYVRYEDDEEKVTVALNLLEPGAEEAGAGEGIPPGEEQPALITAIEEERFRERGKGEKPNVLATILVIIGGLCIMGAVVFLHLRRRTRTIKF